MNRWHKSRTLSIIASVFFAGALMAVGVRDEVPIGGLTGTAVMLENGRALSGATIILRPQFDTGDWHTDSKLVKANADGKFSFANVPAGVYTLEAYTKAHSLPETNVRISEGKNLAVSLELKPADPSLEVNMGQHVFTPGEQPVFNATGFGLDPSMLVAIYKIDFDKIAASGGLQSVLNSAYRWDSGLDTSKTDTFSVVSKAEHEITRRDVEGSFTDEVKLNQLPKGIYWVSAKLAGRQSGTWFAVSDIALIAKSAANQSLCYVTDIVTGKPIPGASVALHIGTATKSIGTSDNNGLLQFSPPKTEESSMALVATRGDSRAIVSFYAGHEDEGNINMFIYTERPVYRPGDEVSYKVILRQLVGADYQVPTGAKAHIEIRDPDDNLIKSSDNPAGNNGTLNGSFRLNSESVTGAYTITCKVGSSEKTKYVQIASYRKPEYTVLVNPDKPYFIRGDRASVTVHSDYYFGGPVVGAKVEAYVYRAPEWTWYSAEDEDYNEEGGDYGGEFVGSFDAETDSDGTATITFDTDDKDANNETDYIYTVRASVSDPSGKYYDGEGKVRVTRGEYALYADTEDYIATMGQKARVTLIAQDQDAKKPVANAIIKVNFGAERWDGETYNVVPAGTITATTGSDGKATVEIPASAPGSMVVEAKGKDSRGNEILARTYIYVEQNGQFTSSLTKPSVSVILDKKQYRIGDTAKVLIRSSAKDASALVTVEGDGIYAYRITKLENGSAIFQMPVTSRYVPNAYVSVALVDGKRLLEGNKRLAVDLSEKRLAINISSDKAVYQPGDTVTYTVTTTDDQGRFVPAEISFGVVDEAIYAIREDTQDIVGAFYPKRYRNVSTYYSFPEIYLGDGDKDKVNVKVREKFLDTAIWIPTLKTDASGTAVVRVQLPDNITTWRATATGVTSDTRVGKATQKVVARKPLMVRLEAPRFLTQGDEVEISAVIHNYSGNSEDVRVTLDPGGLTLNENAAQTVRTNGNEPARVSWKLTATKVLTAMMTAEATSQSGNRDAVKQKLPVQPYGRKMTSNFTGDVRSMGSIRFNIRPGYIQGTGSLKLTITPTLASSLLDSLPYLAGYPYGCTEQTMSRFLPSVVVAQTLRNLGMSQPKLQAQLPNMIQAGYNRLKNYQHSDGGWGWWENDDTEAWMTAYVLEGFARAAAAGFPPPKFMLDDAVKWAKQSLVESAHKGGLAQISRDNSALLRALVLSGHGAAVTNLASAIDESKVFDSGAVINLLVAYDGLGTQFAKQRDTMMQRLVNMAVQQPSLAHWTEDWWGVETTAQAILAISTVNPSHPILPKAIRWLMLQRRADHWYSTRDTAFALIALTDYMKANQETSPNYLLNITINGAFFKSIRVTADQITSPEMQLDIPFAALTPGDNTLSMSIAGQGNCYYSMQVRQTVGEGFLAQPLSGDELRIDRHYYRLESRRLEDGTLRLLPSRNEIESADAGELVRCILTISSPKAREFMMIEDPVPSGCEIVEREDLGPDESWENWWSRTDIRDNRIVFFARTLDAGTHTIEYTLRAEMPGTMRALPASIGNMYDPDARGGTAENSFEITR